MMNQSKRLLKTLISNARLVTLILLFFNINAKGQDLESEFLFEINAQLANTINLGKTPFGVRTIHPVIKGSFKGEKLSGIVLPSGGDWLLALDSTTHKLDVRIVLETDDGALIYSTYTGYIHRNADNSIYFRTNPIFETSSKKYDWLNHTIAVGVGKIIEGGVSYKIYAIK